jgi:DNA-binding XRE family transcriptional regulator
MIKPQPTHSPAQSLALLQGITEDYARLLKTNGNEATAGLVAGVSRETVKQLEADLRELDMIRVQLKTLQDEHEQREETNRLARADTEILPQTIEAIEVGK